MRAHILFEDEPEQYLEQDIYLVTENKRINDLLSVGCHNIIKLDLVMKDPRGDYAESTKVFFSKLPNELESIENDVFSRMIQPLLSIIHQIDTFIHERKIESIVLYGGGNFPYLCAENSEGEKGRTYIYKRSWMFNFFIFQAFKDKCNIIWEKRIFKPFCRILYWFRNESLRIKVLSRFLIEGLTKPYENSFRPICDRINGKAVILIPIWIKQQYEHITSLFEKNSDFVCIYISEKKINNDNSILIKKLTFNEVLSNFMKVNQILKKINSTTLQYGSIVFNINNKVIRQAFARTFLQVSLHYRRLEKTSKELTNSGIKPLLIINNKTWNWSQYNDKKLADNLKIPLITFQYVMMPDVLYPNLKVFDTLFVTSKQLQKRFSGAINQIGIYSGFHINENVKDVDYKNLRIIVFLQPDMFDPCSLSFIQQLVDYFDYFPKQVFFQIKLHYRQNKSFFDQIENMVRGLDRICVVDAKESAKQLIADASVVISFTSAVIFESICSGTLAASFIQEDETIQVVNKSEYLKDECVVKLANMSEVIKFINNIEFEYNLFKDRRIAYFTRLFGNEVRINDIIKRQIENIQK